MTNVIAFPNARRPRPAAVAADTTDYWPRWYDSALWSAAATLTILGVAIVRFGV